MSKISLVLLNNTENNVTAVGTPVRCDGWHGFGERLFTVAVHVSDFAGQVFIEASLADEPGDNDWFSAADPVTFERQSQPVGALSAGFSFRGNFAWIRARMARGDSDFEMPDPTYGFVDRILLNQ
jgi:hypothetical protein